MHRYVVHDYIGGYESGSCMSVARGSCRSDDAEHLVHGRLDVGEVELLRGDAVVHVLLVRRPRQRCDAIHLGNLEQHLGGRAALRGAYRPDTGVA